MPGRDPIRDRKLPDEEMGSEQADIADENKNHDPGPEGPGAILTGKEIPGNGDGQPCPDAPQQADADWPQSQEPGRQDGWNEL